MRWNKWRRSALLTFALLAFLLLRPVGRAADDKRLTVFSPQGNYSVAIVDRDGRAYVAISELLDPLGHPEVRVEGDRIRVTAGAAQAELREGQSKVKVGKTELDLGAKVAVEGSRV